MSLCLVVQKDTLENESVKSIVRSTLSDPMQFLDELQSSHCIEYQLLAFTDNSENLEDETKNLIAPFKTSYGKDWYEFDHNILAKIITLFLTSSHCYVDLRSVSSIMGFSLKMFPVVSKEIKLSSIQTSVDKNSFSEKIDIPEIKDEIVTVLETLEKSERLDKNDRRDKKDKREKREKKEPSKKEN